MPEKLVAHTKKGILNNKLLKKNSNHKDMLVLLRHLAKADNKYILYKRHSIKENNKSKTAYLYRLTTVRTYLIRPFSFFAISTSISTRTYRFWIASCLTFVDTLIYVASQSAWAITSLRTLNVPGGLARQSVRVVNEEKKPGILRVCNGWMLVNILLERIKPCATN